MCKIDGVPAGPHETVSPDDLEHFLRRGYLIIPARVPAEVHEAIRSKAAAIAKIGPHATVQLGDDCLPAVPELWTVLESPAVRQATKAVLGEDYMLHGHRHLHVSSTREQMWHKDSYWGFRRMRHHRPRWCMMLYYPQETTLAMGPTHVLAGSQYWTIDTEKCPQGEDILPDAHGHVSMFVEGSTADRQQRLKEAEYHLLGPCASRADTLAEDVSLTVPAGSCVLMHYDLFHRAGFRAQEDAPTRFMFKFQFVRTREPRVNSGRSCESPRSASPCAASPIAAKVDYEEVAGISKGADFCRRRRQLRRRCPWGSDDETTEFHPEEAVDAALAHELFPVTADVRSWLLGAPHPAEVMPPMANACDSQQEVEKGLEIMRRGGACDCLEVGEADDSERTDHDEVKLVSAAYRLARSPDRTWLALLRALTEGSEAVSRAACYGLAAAGPRVADALIPLLKHSSKRVRVAAAFALGESARPTAEVLSAFDEALLSASLWSLEVAHLLQALSCLAGRAFALSELSHSHRCVELALPYLLPSNGHNIVCENACLVVLLAGELRGDIGEVAVAALQRIADCSGDPYTVNFALEILRRQQVATQPADAKAMDLQEPRVEDEGGLLHVSSG